MGKNNSKKCQMCGEKNNPAFTRCWKCNGQLESLIPLCNPTIHEMWEKDLSYLAKEKLSYHGLGKLAYLGKIENFLIISKKDVEEVINLFIEDKIDPQDFTSNLESLLTGGMSNPSLSILEKMEKHKPTESVSIFNRSASTFKITIDSVLGGPSLWFLAAYPDVMAWLYEEYGTSFDGSPTSIEWIQMLFAEETQDTDASGDEITSTKERSLPRRCKNLVRSYITKTGKALETTVKNTMNNVYAVTEMCESIEPQSNKAESIGVKSQSNNAGTIVKWYWPAMTSLANAERATRWAFGTAMVLTAIQTAGSLLPMTGIGIGGFLDVSAFLALGYGVKRKSRVCALVLLSYFIIAKVIDVVIALVKNHRVGSLGGLAIVCLTGLLFLNGVRGTFAYHKFNKTIINRKIIISKTISAFIYGVVIWFLSMAVLKLIQSHPSEDAIALASIPADIIIWVSYLGWLPFTKGSVMMPNPNSAHS
jgi:hypothetical protein